MYVLNIYVVAIYLYQAFSLDSIAVIMKLYSFAITICHTYMILCRLVTIFRYIRREQKVYYAGKVAKKNQCLILLYLLFNKLNWNIHIFLPITIDFFFTLHRVQAFGLPDLKRLS